MSFDGSFTFSDDADYAISDFQTYQGREGIIFLIDCRKEMFIKDIKPKDEDEPSYISAFVFSLECCREIMLNMIKFSNNTLVSVIFFGVEKGDGNRKHISEFQPLIVSDANKIRQLDEIINSETHKDFESKYGHSESAYLADALSACAFSFLSCSYKLGLKRILLFTKDDNPDEISADMQRQVRKRAHDLSEARIDLDLLPIGLEFNPQLFYQEIIDTVKNEDYKIPTQLVDVYEAIEIINKENHSRRSLSHLKFHLGEQVVIGVTVYRFTRKQTRLFKKTHLSRETNEQVRPVREILDAETGDKLRPYQVVKMTNVGGKEVHFLNDELLKMRKVFEPCIVLLGFKPIDFWKVDYYCCQSFFIFPDESIVKGSRQLFTALLRCCVTKGKAALCTFTARRGSRPKYVLLVPQTEVLNDKGCQEVPAGFHVYVLPFARMFGIIPVTEESCRNPKEDEIEIARKLVKRLKIKKFQPDYFDNPHLVKQWNTLEAVALQLTDVRPFEDVAVMHHEDLGNRLKSKDIPMEFNNTFFKDICDSGSAKRKTTSKTGADVKIPKRSEFIDLATQKKIDKLTVVQLKEILKLVPGLHHNVSRKSDLIELIYNRMEVIKKHLP